MSWQKITLKLFFLISLYSLTTLPVYANIDLTPLVKGMQTSCDINAWELSQKLGKLPTKYKQSVVSNRTKKNQGMLIHIVQFKNVTAFGYPLKAIETAYTIEGSGEYITLYFQNSNYLNLKSKFYYAEDSIKIFVGKKQTLNIPNEIEDITVEVTPNSYLVYATTAIGLNFNEKDNSITCWIDA